MPARRTRSQSAKGATLVSLDTILLATAVGAGVAAYFFLEALASARSTPATRAELKTTLETLGVDFKSSDSTKYLQRKLEVWLEEN